MGTASSWVHCIGANSLRKRLYPIDVQQRDGHLSQHQFEWLVLLVKENVLTYRCVLSHHAPFLLPPRPHCTAGIFCSQYVEVDSLDEAVLRLKIWCEVPKTERHVPPDLPNPTLLLTRSLANAKADRLAVQFLMALAYRVSALAEVAVP